MKQLTVENDTMILNEDSQKIHFKFGFCQLNGDNVTVVHKFFKCRDYMNEVIVSQHTGYSYEAVYGFKLDPKAYPLDMSITRFVVQVDGKTAITKLLSNIKLLHSLEELYGFRLTSFELLKLKGSPYIYYLVEADPRWSSCTLYISLYSYILRILCLANIPDDVDILDDYIEFIARKYSSYDAVYALAQLKAKVTIEFMMNHFEDIIKDSNRCGGSLTKKEDAYNIRTVHNNSGFQSFLDLVRGIRAKVYVEAEDVLVKQAQNFVAIESKEV